jgi:hypothetical protein
MMGTDQGQIDLCARQIYLSVPPKLAPEIAEILAHACGRSRTKESVDFMDKLADALKARINKEAKDAGE